jgi:hypothetical protein
MACLLATLNDDEIPDSRTKELCLESLLIISHNENNLNDILECLGQLSSVFESFIQQERDFAPNSTRLQALLFCLLFTLSGFEMSAHDILEVTENNLNEAIQSLTSVLSTGIESVKECMYTFRYLDCCAAALVTLSTFVLPSAYHSEASGTDQQSMAALSRAYRKNIDVIATTLRDRGVFQAVTQNFQQSCQHVLAVSGLPSTIWNVNNTLLQDIYYLHDIIVPSLNMMNTILLNARGEVDRFRKYITTESGFFRLILLRYLQILILRATSGNYLGKRNPDPLELANQHQKERSIVVICLRALALVTYKVKTLREELRGSNPSLAILDAPILSEDSGILALLVKFNINIGCDGTREEQQEPAVLEKFQSIVAALDTDSRRRFAAGLRADPDLPFFKSGAAAVAFEFATRLSIPKSQKKSHTLSGKWEESSALALLLVDDATFSEAAALESLELLLKAPWSGDMASASMLAALLKLESAPGISQPLREKCWKALGYLVHPMEGVLLPLGEQTPSFVPHLLDALPSVSAAHVTLTRLCENGLMPESCVRAAASASHQVQAVTRSSSSNDNKQAVSLREASVGSLFALSRIRPALVSQLLLEIIGDSILACPERQLSMDERQHACEVLEELLNYACSTEREENQMAQAVMETCLHHDGIPILIGATSAEYETHPEFRQAAASVLAALLALAPAGGEADAATALEATDENIPLPSSQVEPEPESALANTAKVAAAEEERLKATNVHNLQTEKEKGKETAATGDEEAVKMPPAERKGMVLAHIGSTSALPPLILQGQRNVAHVSLLQQQIKNAGGLEAALNMMRSSDPTMVLSGLDTLGQLVASSSIELEEALQDGLLLSLLHNSSEVLSKGALGVLLSLASRPSDAAKLLSSSSENINVRVAESLLSTLHDALTSKSQGMGSAELSYWERCFECLTEILRNSATKGIVENVIPDPTSSWSRFQSDALTLLARPDIGTSSVAVGALQCLRVLWNRKTSVKSALTSPPDDSATKSNQMALFAALMKSGSPASGQSSWWIQVLDLVGDVQLTSASSDERQEGEGTKDSAVELAEDKQLQSNLVAILGQAIQEGDGLCKTTAMYHLESMAGFARSAVMEDGQLRSILQQLVDDTSQDSYLREHARRLMQLFEPLEQRELPPTGDEKEDEIESYLRIQKKKKKKKKARLAENSEARLLRGGQSTRHLASGESDSFQFDAVSTAIANPSSSGPLSKLKLAPLSVPPSVSAAKESSLIPQVAEQPTVADPSAAWSIPQTGPASTQPQQHDQDQALAHSNASASTGVPDQPVAFFQKVEQPLESSIGEMDSAPRDSSSEDDEVTKPATVRTSVARLPVRAEIGSNHLPRDISRHVHVRKVVIGRAEETDSEEETDDDTTRRAESPNGSIISFDEDLPSWIPQRYLCALGGTLMSDPVLTPRGHMFDREAIEDFIERQGKCPITGQPLEPSDLVRDDVLRDEISQYRYQYMLQGSFQAR